MKKLSPNLIKLFKSKFEIEVSEDKLEATITIPAFKWPKLKSSEILTYFEENSEFKGEFDREIFKQAIKARGETFSLIKGKPPKDGIDGKIEKVFEESDGKAKPKILESGHADFKELGLIKCVNKDQVLFKVTPMEPEENGINIYGETIVAKEAIELPIELMENVRYDRKDQTIKSNISGFPLFDGEKINVTNTVEIEQDIDLSIGNIDVPCSLTIKGSIKEGFTVKAQGDILVTQNIENGTAKCTGNLIVKGVVNHSYKGKVSCGKDFECKSLNHAKVKASGNCKIIKESMFSDITCRGDIECKGIIIGGTIISQKGNITIKEVGSKIEAATTQIKIYPTDELFDKIDEYTKSIIYCDTEYEKLEREKEEVENYLSQPNIPAKEFNEFEKIFDDFMKKQKEIKAKKTEDQMILESLKAELKNIEPGVLNIKGTIYPGVKIKITDLLYLVRDEDRHTTYYSDGNKIDRRML